MVNMTGHIPISFQPKRQPRVYSLVEYMRLEAKSKDKHEFVNGQIIKMPYAKGPHNIISANISAEMRFGLKKMPNKYVLFSSDQQIYFPSLNVGVYECYAEIWFRESPERWTETIVKDITQSIALQ